MPTYAKNKKALFDYDVLETFEAGLVLAGHETKAVRNGQIQLKGAYVTFKGDDPMLTNAHISKYKFAGNVKEYDPERSRKLLLQKKEISYLQGKMHEKGLTIVPLSVYTKGPRIKVEIGVMRGKKKHDKRRSIKDREQKRVMRRALKGDLD